MSDGVDSDDDDDDDDGGGGGGDRNDVEGDISDCESRIANGNICIGKGINTASFVRKW